MRSCSEARSVLATRRGTNLARRVSFGLAIWLLLCSLPSRASATPSFPDTIASHLGSERAPDCAICHEGATQRGTVTTLFGSALRARGLVAYDDPSLRTALDALSAEKRDSDGDGAPDIDEVRAGRDPSAAEGTPSDSPTYGCAVSATLPSEALGRAALLVAVASWLIRRRRRRAGPSAPREGPRESAS